MTRLLEKMWVRPIGWKDNTAVNLVDGFLVGADHDSFFGVTLRPEDVVGSQVQAFEKYAPIDLLTAAGYVPVESLVE